MTPDHWRRINEVFDAAVALDGENRKSYLAETCRDDAQLRQEVDNLLAAHESAEASMQTVSVRQAVQQLAKEFDTSAIGQDFGNYRIIREIGRGGMGRVFLAERADQEFHKRVAIKLIKRGMDTDSVVRRFRNEREILASLDHPNIARLLDGGTSPDGLPYFVMEYIEGLPIERFCDERKSTIAERLRLFRKVCAAVAYAHQHLVIHRDIKPSNILVTAEGEPKLLDFGIARMLHAGADSHAAATVTGVLVMTPEYASPEQVLGMPASTLTDVYSLGVVLYQLLSGSSPYEFRNSSPLEMAEAICRREPTRPSTAAIQPRANVEGDGGGSASAEGRRERIARQLRGDLDNIVLMGMRKEPERRYQSVEQFSDDIRRHLESLPVQARDDTAGYRIAKFIRRHRPIVAAAAIATLMVVAGITSTVLAAQRARVQEQLAKAERVKAERRFNEVRQLAHAVLFDYHDAIKNLPGATPVREHLVRDGLRYLDNLASEATGDRSLLRELASAYRRVADVQGGSMEANLGNTAGAIESDRKAIRILESLLASAPRDISTRGELAASYFRLGSLLWETGDLAGAADFIGRAVRVREDLVKSDEGNVALRRDLSSAYDRLGLLLFDKGDAAGALTDFRRSLEMYTSAPKSEQSSESARRSISVEYEHIGSALQELGDLTGALENNSRALSIRSGLAKDFPLNVDHKRTLQVSYYNQGEVLARMGRTHDALSSYRTNVAIGEKLYREDPKNEQSRGDLAYGLIRVGDMLFKLHNSTEALANYRRSHVLRSADVTADPANLWKRSSLIEASAKMCKTLAATDQADDARAPCSEALSLMQGTTLETGNMAIRSFFADTYSDLGDAQSTLAASQSTVASERRNRWQSARDLYGKSREIWLDLQRRKILGQSDRAKPKAVSLQIARCEAALR